MWKMRGSGFITPTAPESMTHSTSIPDARTDLQDLVLGESLADQAVGVGDDAEPHARLLERAQPVARAGKLTDPERGVGELAVEMLVHVVAHLVGHAARGDVAVEVHAPRAGPVELVGHRELARAP